MKRFIALVFFVLLSGCSATQVPYSPEPMTNREDSARVIEQVIMEQSAKYRPESVLITDDYLAFGEGYSEKSTGLASGTKLGSNAVIGVGSSRTKGKAINSRLYFNSLGVPQLYTKRGWYIIQVVDNHDAVLKRYYTRDKHKAESFIDALTYFIVHAEPIK